MLTACVKFRTMPDSNARLRIARKRAGFTSARQAAIRYGWNLSTYASHENGQTPVPPEAAKRYAQKFKVPAGWILTGDGSPDGYSQDDALIRGVRLADPAKKRSIAVLLGIDWEPEEDQGPPPESPDQRSSKRK